MKKIININLSGRVIPIEDSAYEMLQGYIESLRRYFAHEEGRDEIINDIESRIAELLHDKVRKGATAITDADVSEIIASMGRPEDLAAEEAETTETHKQPNQEQYTYTSRKTKGRLYRDTSDKFIGGVCSGIAAYLNVDPAIVRILFAIITFGGFGLGFLAYILLWIILPPRDLEGFRGKRLFRNPDDRVIGGVAGGLAAYFGRSTSTIRIIFAAPLLLNIFVATIDMFRWGHDFDFFPNLVFGSLSGTFILAYVVLWMVLPEARSPYEKMEMRGEKVDLHSIRQNVREGADNVKERMKDWTAEVKDTAQNLGNKAKAFAGTRGKTFANEFGETARRGGQGLGHAIGVLFKVFFLFIAGTIAFGLFVAVIILSFGAPAWWPINNFLWTSQSQQLFAWGTLIFFFLVPLLGFIIWLIRRIIGTRSRHNYLGWTFGSLWALGWICAIFLASSMSRDFRVYRNISENVAITQPSKGKMIVAVSEPELDYTGTFGWMNENGEEGWDLSNDTFKLSTLRFAVKPSKDSLYYVSIRRFAFGRNEQDAMYRANRIQYSVVSRDSILDLANGYSIDKESKFRGQQVEVEIMVPIGKKIRFDHSVNDKLNPVNVEVRRRYNRNRVNIDINDDYWRHFRPDVDYTMGIDGNLKDSSGKMIESEYHYQQDYEDTMPAPAPEPKKPSAPKNTSVGKLESIDDEEIVGNASSSSSSYISLVSWF